MNLIELKTYILADPVLSALAGVAGVSGRYNNSKDQTVIENANARKIAGVKKVPFGLVFLLLIEQQKWRGIKRAALDAAHPAIEAAFSFAELQTAPNLEVNFISSEFNIMLSTMVSSTLITAQNKIDIQALSTVEISEMESRFGRQLQNLDVARAFGRTGLGV